MKLKETDHNYYCSENNYHVGNRFGENYGRSEYDTWINFKEEWLEEDETLDCDYNLCFRYDITRKRDEDDNELNEYSLWLFFILQRKGIYRPVWIKSIKEEDMGQLDTFLKHQWDYMKNQWIEVDKGE